MLLNGGRTRSLSLPRIQQIHQQLCNTLQLVLPGKASELLARPLKQIEIEMKGPADEHADHCQ
jgi:hypothetical protein